MYITRVLTEATCSKQSDSETRVVTEINVVVFRYRNHCYTVTDCGLTHIGV